MNLEQTLEQLKAEAQKLSQIMQESLQRADMAKAQLLKLEGAAEMIVALMQKEASEAPAPAETEAPAEAPAEAV